MTAPAPVAARSLQHQLLWTVLGVVGVVWLLVVMSTWADTQHEVDELLDAHLSQAASLLVSQPLDELNRIVFPESPVLHEYQSRVVVQVWHQNELMVRSATAPLQPLAPSGQLGLSSVQLDGREWRVFSAAGRDEHVVVHVAEQEDFRADVLVASLRSVIWPMTLALPLMGLAIWWAVRRAVQPLQTLGNVVAQRPPGGLEPLPTAQVPLEAQPMVAALNRLFARTAELMDAERRFTADAAHELRTPMAAIRMQAQVAQGATDALERDEALAATVQGCDRATHLMEQLLQLARLESQDTVATSHCNLHACVHTVLTDLQAMATRRGQQIIWPQDPGGAGGTGPESGVWVPSPAGLTTVLLRNLLDNALRYSPPGASVRLHLDTGARQAPSAATGEPLQPGQARQPDPALTKGQTALSGQALPVRLVLQDSGPGLSDTDLKRLGERFFRVLGSGEAGSGLGWSIVSRVARLYGLSVEVGRSADLGGLQVAVTWPVPTNTVSDAPSA